MGSFQEEIDVYPLFVGLTRPPMYAGVTFTFFMINFFINVILLVGAGSFIPIIILFPLLHGLGYLCCMVDPCIFDILFGKFQLLRCKNAGFWGCNSYDPY